MGHQITKDGNRADPSKVTAIREITSLTDIHSVKRFCAMVQYLARFMPNSDCENALIEVKRRIAQPPILTFYDQEADLVLQVDNSKDGLMQNDQPVEYASRALTKTERNWEQIKKELLSVVFGLERFDQYTYGQKIIIHNDYGPLETILKKPLSQAPKRLQALAMRINGYDIAFNYVPAVRLPTHYVVLIQNSMTRVIVLHNFYWTLLGRYSRRNIV